MPTRRKSLTERITEKLGALNNRLETHVRRNDVLLNQMNSTNSNEKSAALIKQYFHLRK